MVKINRDLYNFIQRENRRLCKKMKIKDRPLILLGEGGLELMHYSRKQIKESKIKHLGLSWEEENIIWLNPENSDFLWQIVDTLVHELVHIKYPKLRHGIKFQNLVNDIILGVRN